MLFGKRSVEQFDKDVTQTLIVAMMSAKIVSTPIMHFLKNGNHLRDAYLHQLMSDPGIEAMCGGERDRYFLVLAYYALGAGAFVTVKSGEGEDISSISTPSGKKILGDMTQVGSLDLGLKAIHIDPESNNKKVIDHFMMSSLSAIMKEYGKEMRSSQRDIYKTALMELYFNAGVTIAIVRTSACP